MTDDELLVEVTAFLQANRTASLSTVDATGHPHAANVQFAVDENLSLYFVSNLKSAHSQHIAIDPRIALSIYAPTDDGDPTQIHGLQMHGQCQRITDPAALEQCWRTYTTRFPFIKENRTLEARVRSESFFTVTPSWFRWIDNRKTFGFKREMHLTA